MTDAQTPPRTAQPTATALAAPEPDGIWLRPASTFPAEPRWGHPRGIQVGISPIPGPNGLLRIFAPYLDHPRERLVNFIAIEPVPRGHTERGFSELEQSSLDEPRGKRFWSTDTGTGTAANPADVAAPRLGEEPARGTIETIDGVEYLRVYIGVERFDNGAHVYLSVTFRADRPHEFAIAAYAHDDSVPLDFCLVTATMGNFSRLRRLHLAGRTVTSHELWPDFEGSHFADHYRFPLEELTRNDAGDAIVSATPDETAPHAAVYGDDVAQHWKYFGKRASQTWRVESPHPDLEVLVNGRAAYWASTSPIPGGISFENFELLEPFSSGREFYFSIEPLD